MKPISKHRKLSAAITRGEREARKAKTNIYIRAIGKGFQVFDAPSKNDVQAIEYVAPQNTRCQHCQSDTGSPRASNCKRCSELKNDVHRDRVSYLKYADLMAIFEKLSHLKEQAFHEATQATIEKKRELNKRKEQEEFKRKARLAEIWQQRQINNETLKRNGYKWIPIAMGTEEDWAPGGYYAGIGEYSHNEWELHSPEGNVVSVAEALKTIERKEK